MTQLPHYNLSVVNDESIGHQAQGNLPQKSGLNRVL